MTDPARPADRSDADLVQALEEALPTATAVYLFGSLASGGARRGSDVDLAVLDPIPLTADRMLRVREQLAERLGRDVDLLDLARASTVIQAQVVSSGRLLRDLDRSHRERFEAYVYSAYARLNEERRGILERIRSEGRIHG